MLMNDLNRCGGRKNSKYRARILDSMNSAILRCHLAGTHITTAVSNSSSTGDGSVHCRDCSCWRAVSSFENDLQWSSRVAIISWIGGLIRMLRRLPWAASSYVGFADSVIINFLVQIHDMPTYVVGSECCSWQGSSKLKLLNLHSRDGCQQVWRICGALAGLPSWLLSSRRGLPDCVAHLLRQRQYVVNLSFYNFFL